MNDFLALGGFLALHHLWQGGFAFCLLKLLERLPQTVHSEILYWFYTAILYALALAPLFIFLPWHNIATLDNAELQVRLEPHFAHLSQLFWPAAFLGLILGVGAMVQTVKLIGCIRRSYQLRHAGEPASLVGSDLPTELYGLKIVISDQISSPMIAGIINPTVLLPAGFIDSASSSELRGALLHEQRHIKRYDMIFSLIEGAIGAIYWWSPFIRGLVRRTRVLREIDCDAHAAKKEGDPIAYAKLLIETARRINPLKLTPSAMVGLYSDYGL